MDVYGNWGVGLDSAVNSAYTVWNNYFWLNGYKSPNSKVSNEPQTITLLQDVS